MWFSKDPNFELSAALSLMNSPDAPPFIHSNCGEAPVGQYLNVEGIVLPHNYYGFLAYRFRPVIERKTDISIFTEMLNKSPQHQLTE